MVGRRARRSRVDSAPESTDTSVCVGLLTRWGYGEMGDGDSARRRAGLPPLITRDPVSGGELIVTRLESPRSGVVIEGAFSLGWIGRLTPEQLEFAGLLVR